jgi:hypothetical protein
MEWGKDELATTGARSDSAGGSSAAGRWGERTVVTIRIATIRVHCQQHVWPLLGDLAAPFIRQQQQQCAPQQQQHIGADSV